MIPNRISNQIAREDIDEIIAKLDEIKEALPFLIGLTPRERKQMLKAGDRSRGFIEKALEVGQQISEYLPRALDLAEMAKDVDLMDALYPIMISTSQLAQKLSDTYAVVNSEAYAGALVIYRSAKDAKGVAGMDEALDDLGRRFARRSSGARIASEPAEPVNPAEPAS